MTTLLEELTAHRDHKADGRVFGLVLQGGGMRAVYTAAAIAPLIQHGFMSTFNHVIGSSAGGINGTYFLGGDEETYRTYTDDISNKSFVNMLRRKKRVDIDFLIDEAMQQKRQVHLPTIRKSVKAGSKLHIVMTNAETGAREVISEHDNFTNIYEEFRATAALPLLYDKQITVNGTKYIDGGVADLIPIDVAYELGCTDIVVIMTQTVESCRHGARHQLLVNRLTKRFAAKKPAAIREILPTNEQQLQTNLDLIEHPKIGSRIYLLQPSDESALVTRTTIDKPKLEAFAKLAMDDTEAFLCTPI